LGYPHSYCPSCPGCQSQEAGLRHFSTSCVRLLARRSRRPQLASCEVSRQFPSSQILCYVRDAWLDSHKKVCNQPSPNSGRSTTSDEMSAHSAETVGRANRSYEDGQLRRGQQSPRRGLRCFDRDARLGMAGITAAWASGPQSERLYCSDPVLALTG